MGKRWHGPDGSRRLITDPKREHATTIRRVAAIARAVAGVAATAPAAWAGSWPVPVPLDMPAFSNDKRKSAGRPRRGTLNALPAFGRRRTLPAGATLALRITARAMIGKVVRYRSQNGKLPKASTLCLRPGARGPQRSS